METQDSGDISIMLKKNDNRIKKQKKTAILGNETLKTGFVNSSQIDVLCVSYSSKKFCCFIMKFLLMKEQWTKAPFFKQVFKYVF